MNGLAPAESPKPSWAIALIANRAALPFLSNALIGICRCGIDPTIVRVGAPEGHIGDVGRLVESFGARVVRLPDDETAADQSAADELLVYGSVPFNRFTEHKYLLSRTLLTEGHHVVYADVDVAWIRNPLPYLERVLTLYCCAVQTEAVGLFPPLPICAGFLAFAPTPGSLRMLEVQIDSFAATIAAGGRSSDQDVIRSVVMNDPQFLRSTFPLPEALFPNGRLESVVAARGRRQGVTEEPEPFVFHANWTEGSKSKQALLERAGAWFVGEMARPVRR